MLLAATQDEDLDRFLEVFSTDGADKRRQHDSSGAVVFDWDADGWQTCVSDPEVPAILQRAGHRGRPEPAAFAGSFGV
ncbi:hypothetical protein [Solirubrobacter soli]|uniref:hypothetical protein n=1 Tax=Solirubrobacter soli TaxID=363832 RepID=UPI00040D2294|nr:hypothetical protein [Solirubrobacter soli]